MKFRKDLHTLMVQVPEQNAMFQQQPPDWPEVTPTRNVNDLEAQMLPLRLQVHDLVVWTDGYSISPFQGTGGYRHFHP